VLVRTIPGGKRTTKSSPPRRHRNPELRDTPDWIASLVRKLPDESGPKRAFAEKAIRAVTELMDLSEQQLGEAAAEEDKYLALLRAMESPQLLKQLRAVDPLSGALIRGIETKRRLIRDNGGGLTAERVAEVLGISPQAVNKRRAAQKLLGLSFSRRGYLYPAWQFDSLHGILPGLEDTLLALHDHDEWTQNIFFVTPNSRLGDRRPVDLLREGQPAGVLDAALALGHHGAA